MLEVLPVFVFFVAFKVSQNISIATISTIIATFVQLVCAKLLGKKTNFAGLSLLSIIIFGGATIYFKNAWFIKIKPSIVYLVLALLLVRNQKQAAKNKTNLWLEKIAAHSIKLPTSLWHTLTICWCYYFVTLGILNLIIAYSFNTQAWINYKLFSTIIFTPLFTIAQYVYINKKSA